MAIFRVLADGKIKFTLLTTAPADPSAPTVTELTAGIDLSCNVLQENFNFGPTDSDKVAEKALCTTGNANSLGASNGQASFSLWRWFKTAGGFDSTADAPFAALKSKGTTVWLYARQMDKLATAAWASGDEFYYGAEVVTDRPQRSDGGGFIKYVIPCEVQKDWAFGTVAAGA